MVKFSKSYYIVPSVNTMGFFTLFLSLCDFIKFAFSVKTFLYRKLFYIFVFCLLFCSAQVQALKIKFPDEELASESVLPLMDKPQMILNRNVPLKYRAEFGLGMGFGLDEPFYFPFYGTAHVAFHVTEAHAVSLVGTYFPPMLSSRSETLRDTGVEVEEKDPDGTRRIRRIFLDPTKAPYPQLAAFLNYQYTPYYGKISLAKNWVLNLSIYGFIGPGLLVFHTNDRIPAVNFGIGQKLYINRWLGVRADLGFYGYYGPAVARIQLGKDVRTLSYSQIKDEQKRPIINFLINLGVIFLI